MENIVKFEFDGNSIRETTINNSPWFIASDVCIILEIGNVSQAISRLDDDEKGIITIDTHGGGQKSSIINESGLYSLILTSRMPNAKAFKKWITSEVIPAIRKTGSYSIENIDPLELLERALNIAKAERARANQLQSENTAMKPLADYSSDVLQSPDLIAVNAVALELGISNVKLYEYLKWRGILYKNVIWYVFADYRDLDLFRYATHRHYDKAGNPRSSEYLKVTQKGRRLIVELYNGAESVKACYNRLFGMTLTISGSITPGVNGTHKINSVPKDLFD